MSKADLWQVHELQQQQQQMQQVQPQNGQDPSAWLLQRPAVSAEVLRWLQAWEVQQAEQQQATGLHGHAPLHSHTTTLNCLCKAP